MSKPTSSCLFLLALCPWLLTAAPPSLQEDSLPHVSDEALEKIEEIIEEEIVDNLAVRYLGLTPNSAASSCNQIAQLKPGYDSGYYWIKGTSGPTGVYCQLKGERFGREGGWMRGAYVNMSELSSQCPIGLQLVTSPKRLCKRLTTPGCHSTIFPVQTQYSKVCGKAIAYQYGGPNGFGPARYTPGINQIYLDGISLTYGSPRKHIWSFAAVLDNTDTSNSYSCPCMDPVATFNGVIPAFVGNNYFCETGLHDGAATTRLYPNDPLFDAKGCKEPDTCCARGGPWFCVDLSQPTSEDIEMRICTNEDSLEDVLLESVEIYVQ